MPGVRIKDVVEAWCKLSHLKLSENFLPTHDPLGRMLVENDCSSRTHWRQSAGLSREMISDDLVVLSRAVFSTQQAP